MNRIHLAVGATLAALAAATIGLLSSGTISHYTSLRLPLVGQIMPAVDTPPEPVISPTPEATDDDDGEQPQGDRVDAGKGHDDSRPGDDSGRSEEEKSGNPEDRSEGAEAEGAGSTAAADADEHTSDSRGADDESGTETPSND